MATIKRPKGTLSPTKKVSQATQDRESDKEFSISKSKSVPSGLLGAFTILLFGERKIGKTSMMAQAPRSYFMMFEPGAKSLSIYQDAYVRWSQVKKGIRQIIRDDRFDTVVIDIVDKMFRLCEKYVCRKLGIDHVSEADWGKGWSALRDEFESEVNLLLQSGKGVVFISHATERELRIRGGGTYDTLTSTMPKTAREIIEGLVDIWVYYGYDGDRRQLWIRGNEHISAGHRLKNHFRHNDQDIKVIDMGSSEEESWKNFIDAFNNRYVPTVSEEETERATKKLKKVKR